MDQRLLLTLREIKQPNTTTTTTTTPSVSGAIRALMRRYACAWPAATPTYTAQQVSRLMVEEDGRGKKEQMRKT